MKKIIKTNDIELNGNIKNEIFIFLKNLLELNEILRRKYKKKFNRTLPLADQFLDRWEKAKFLKFGKNSSIYDSAYVFGKVTAGKYVWVGPFTILDGSGGLKIGNYCTISAGVHIYTHDNIEKTLSRRSLKVKKKAVTIGDHCYIGPHTILSRGVSIGSHSVVAAGSFVNASFPRHSVIAGTPAKRIGITVIKKGNVTFQYL